MMSTAPKLLLAKVGGSIKIISNFCLFNFVYFFRAPLPFTSSPENCLITGKKSSSINLILSLDILFFFAFNLPYSSHVFEKSTLIVNLASFAAASTPALHV